MNNFNFIKEFIKGEREYNAYCHLGYKGNILTNYSKDIAIIDRVNKKALVNTRKYSRSTTNIQSTLLSLLEQNGYTIEQYDGGACQWWNCGYVGADRLTIEDVKSW